MKDRFGGGSTSMKKLVIRGLFGRPHPISHPEFDMTKLALITRHE
jgi:hypothetical protein